MKNVMRNREPTHDTLTVHLTVLGALDADELERAARDLRDELAATEDVRDVRAAESPKVAGSKGDGVTLGTLLLTLLPSATGTALASGLFNWAMRDQRRVVEVKIGDNSIKLTGVDKAKRDELVAMFIAHTRSPHESEDA